MASRSTAATSTVEPPAEDAPKTTDDAPQAEDAPQAPAAGDLIRVGHEEPDGAFVQHGYAIVLVADPLTVLDIPGQPRVHELAFQPFGD